MTKEKTARLIPNAIQVSTDTEKVRLEHVEARSGGCQKKKNRWYQSSSLLIKVIQGGNPHFQR